MNILNGQRDTTFMVEINVAAGQEVYIMGDYIEKMTKEHDKEEFEKTKRVWNDGIIERQNELIEKANQRRQEENAAIPAVWVNPVS
jgi:hypothetical protein